MSRSALDELIVTLAAAGERIESGADAIPELKEAIQAVMRLVAHDPGETATQALRPLALLHSAIHDLERGARPPLLFEYRPQIAVTKPTGTFQEYARGHLAAALDLLIWRGGMKPREAGAWLENCLATHGVRDRAGHRIPAQRIQRWRHEANAGTGPKVSRDQFDYLRTAHRDPKFLDPKRALDRARAIVWNLARFGFRHSPPDSRSR